MTGGNKKREKDVSKKVYTELSTHNYERNGNERTKFNSRIEKRICNWSADYRGYFLPVTVSDDHVLKCTERFFPTVFLLEQFNAILCLFLILFLYKKKNIVQSNLDNSNISTISTVTFILSSLRKIKLTLIRIYR